MIKRNDRLLAVLFAMVFLLACAPLAAPTAPPTYDLLSINTSIASTAEAALTQTAFFITPTLTPTATLIPTKTPLPTETPSATFIFALPTFTPTLTETLTPTQVTLSVSGDDFKCQLISQSPANNTVISHSAAFDAHWQVANIGKLPWDENNANYLYSSGQKMYKTRAFDFNQTVAPGGMIEFVVPMRAPDGSGTYTTTWKISSGKDVFCPMSIKIVVK